jgi:competence protein ComEA
VSLLTREERNVLLFVALGVLLGSLPGGIGNRSATNTGGAGEAPSASVIERDPFPIDVNREGPELLELLPGIGPVKARAIVATRESGGRFETIEDLDRVPGIGPRTVERLRGLVTTGTEAGGADAETESAATEGEEQLVDGTARDSSSRE